MATVVRQVPKRTQPVAKKAPKPVVKVKADKVPKRKLVIIEEGLITSMAHNAAFTKEFAFLNSIKGYTTKSSRKAGCGSCNRSGKERTAIFTSAKQAIAGMGNEQRRRLKELLNTDQARLTYVNSKNKTIELTF